MDAARILNEREPEVLAMVARGKSNGRSPGS